MFTGHSLVAKRRHRLPMVSIRSDGTVLCLNRRIDAEEHALRRADLVVTVLLQRLTTNTPAMSPSLNAPSVTPALMLTLHAAGTPGEREQVERLVLPFLRDPGDRRWAISEPIGVRTSSCRGLC